MEAASSSASPTSTLLTLPPDVLQDHVFPHLSVLDLVRLRLANHFLRSLVEDEIVWKRRIKADFNFPEHATNRVRGWRNLYRGLARPQTYVWGQSANERLGIPPERFDEEMRRFIFHQRGAPFPLRLDIAGAGDRDVGAPVEVVAGGWSFHVLTSKGEVLFWGQLMGQDHIIIHGPADNLHQPEARVKTPRVLDRNGAAPIKSLSCGRSFGLALTQDQEILEWHTWKKAVRHETLPQMNNPRRKTRIQQVEAGWDFAVALLHSEPLEDPDEPGSSIRPQMTFEVVFWYTVPQHRRMGLRGQASNPGSGSTSDWLDVARFSLPEIPPVPAQILHELASETFADSQMISNVAAGENFIVALTTAGLLYHIPVHPSANRSQHGEWTLLEDFCLPSRIGQLDYFQSNPQQKDRLLNARTKITHIGAQFQTFVAYTSSESAVNDGPDADQGGIVLLGRGTPHSDTTPESERTFRPMVKPELQGKGIIKVSMGDWHYGALTSSGKLLTWGQWSQGALGTWDSLDMAEQRPPTTAAQPTPAPVNRGTTEERGRGGGVFGGLRGGPRRARIGLAATHIRRAPRAEDEDGEQTARPGPSDQADRENQGGSSSSTSPTGPARQTASQAWSHRMKSRIVPNSIDEPRGVVFDPVRPEKTYVYDIAFAGWHSAALTLDSSLFGTNAADATEGEDEKGDIDGGDDEDGEEEYDDRRPTPSYQRPITVPFGAGTRVRSRGATLETGEIDDPAFRGITSTATVPEHRRRRPASDARSADEFRNLRSFDLHDDARHMTAAYANAWRMAAGCALILFAALVVLATSVTRTLFGSAGEGEGENYDRNGWIRALEGIFEQGAFLVVVVLMTAIWRMVGRVMGRPLFPFT